MGNFSWACAWYFTTVLRRNVVIELVMLILYGTPPTKPQSEAITVQVAVSALEQDPWSEATAARFQRSLPLRLVEEGFVVVPTQGSAGVTLDVWVDPEHTVLSAHGARTRTEMIERTSPELLELELHHRAASLVAEAGIRPHTPEPAAAVEVVCQSEGLRTTLATTLLQNGWSLASSPGLARHRICAEGTEDDYRLSVQDVDVPCDWRSLSQLNPQSGGDDMLTRLDARQVSAVAQAQDAEVPTPIEPLPRPAPPRPSESWGLWETRPEVGGGAIGRRASVGGSVTVGVRYGKARGPGAWVGAGLWPSKGPGVTVREWTPRVGADWQFGVARRVTLDVALGGGVHVSSYERGARRGHRVGALALLELGPTFNVVAGLGMGVALSVGMASGRVTQISEQEVLWSRGLVFAGLGLRMSYAFTHGRNE